MFRAYLRRSLGARPIASRTPGRKGSMSTSVLSTIFLNSVRPASFLRSIAIERLPRDNLSLSSWTFGFRGKQRDEFACRRHSRLPRLVQIKFCHFDKPTLSTRMTLAPKSASTMPQNGAGARPASSTTRIPRRAIRTTVFCNEGVILT